MRDDPVEITRSANRKTCASRTRRAETPAVSRTAAKFFFSAKTETRFHFRFTCRQICFEDSAIKTFENAATYRQVRHTRRALMFHTFSRRRRRRRQNRSFYFRFVGV